MVEVCWLSATENSFSVIGGNPTYVSETPPGLAGNLDPCSARAIARPPYVMGCAEMARGKKESR